MENRSYPEGYVVARGRAQALVAFLWATVGLNVLVALVGLGSISMLEQVAAKEELGIGTAIAALAFGFAALLRAATYITTMVLVLVWLYRAVANLKVLRPDAMLGTSPGFAVGCWFIPFYNLGKPYMVVSDLWTYAAFLADGDDGLQDANAGRIGWWWAAYLVGNLVITAGDKMGEMAVGTGRVTWAVGAAIHVAAAMLLMRIVRRIDARLDDKARRVALEGARYPQPPGSTPLIA